MTLHEALFYESMKIIALSAQIIKLHAWYDAVQVPEVQNDQQSSIKSKYNYILSYCIVYRPAEYPRQTMHFEWNTSW